MRYDTQDKYLADAFATVKRYDPATYQRMDADHKWFVTTDFSILPEQMYSPEMETAFGTTWTDKNPGLKMAVTFIYADYINDWADEKGVDRTYFAAAVLVHEYRHAHQDDMGPAAEVPAFAAGSAFAAKLPPGHSEQAIKHLSDTTGAEAKRAAMAGQR